MQVHPQDATHNLIIPRRPAEPEARCVSIVAGLNKRRIPRRPADDVGAQCITPNSVVGLGKRRRGIQPSDWVRVEIQARSQHVLCNVGKGWFLARLVERMNQLFCLISSCI